MRLGLGLNINKYNGGVVAVPPPIEFITKWDLSKAGSGATQLTFGVAVSGTVSYEWEEVSPGGATGSGTFSTSTLTITGLPSGAVIRLKINPTNFQRIIINNGIDKSRLVEVENCGTTAWTSMKSAFRGANNLLYVDILTAPNLSGVIDMNSMFRDCVSLTTLNISSWDVSSVTNMAIMFQNCTSLTTLDVSSWDVSSVINMANMFENCSSLTNLDISSWDVSKVTNMYRMFRNCSSLDTLGADNWNIAAINSTANQSMQEWCNGVTLTTTNYSDILINFAGLTTPPSNVIFYGGSSKYNSAGATARNTLVTTYNWTITDGGPE